MKTALTIGRGKLYFEKFLPGTRVGTGELYLGNTPALSIQTSVENLETAKSYRGIKIAGEKHAIQEKHTVSFATDHISRENVALWLRGESSSQTFAYSTLVETAVLFKNRYFQIGVTPDNPLGKRNAFLEKVKVGGVSIPLVGNFTFHEKTGRLYVLPDAAISDGAEAEITFSLYGATVQRVPTASAEVLGRLRFVASNQRGENRDFFFPYVALTVTGAYNVKSDEWQQLVFSAEVRRLGPLVEAFYSEGVVVLEEPTDQFYLERIEGISVEQFCLREDELNTILNTTMPANGY